MAGWPQLRETRIIKSGDAPGTVVRCGLRDTMLASVPASIVFFYDHPLPEEELAGGLARALAAVPVFGGRMRTVADRLEIVCSDAGVPLEFYTIDETLPEAIGRVAMPNSGLVDHCDAAAARTGDLPLLKVRVSRLADGGTAVGTSFCHAVGDLQTYMLLMRAWSAAASSMSGEEAVVVEDRDAYLDAILPPGDSGLPSFRLPDPEEAALLDAEIQASARANRTVQLYFTDAEVRRMREAFEAEAGRKLSTNNVLAAHVHTVMRDLDTTYEGIRHISMAVNIRPRLELPRTVVGNLLSEIHVPCAPDATAAQFASEIRTAMEAFATTPLNFRADQRLIAEIGRDRLGDCAPYAFDPPHRTFSLSSWTRVGYPDVSFDGHQPVMMSSTTAISLPWVAWLVEGFHGTDYLMTLVVPVRFAGKLKGADGRARLHRYRLDEDKLPPLAEASGKLL
jgi:hypothetical protein